MHRICIKSIIIDCTAFYKEPKKSVILSKKWIILSEKMISLLLVACYQNCVDDALSFYFLFFRNFHNYAFHTHRINWYLQIFNARSLKTPMADPVNCGFFLNAEQIRQIIIKKLISLLLLACYQCCVDDTLSFYFLIFSYRHNYAFHAHQINCYLQVKFS